MDALTLGIVVGTAAVVVFWGLGSLRRRHNKKDEMGTMPHSSDNLKAAEDLKDIKRGSGRAEGGFG